ncbi:unnamed protein product [Effrenium voratum]|nr:unnamed protein product [Effrenium voratum]
MAVTGDLGQIVTHMNVAVPSLTKLCSMGEELGTLEQIQVMYMSRQAWILASILESLSIDDYIHLEGVADQPRRVLPRSELKFELLSGSVAATVADILLRMYGLGGAQLRAVAASCMGFFLKGQRSFTKDKRISELLAGSLSSGDLLLCRKGLETLSALLGHFRVEADKESKAGAVDFADSRDHRVAGKSKETTTNSAIEAAQPLAAFADQALAHISLSGSVGPAAKPKKSRKRSASVAPPTPPTPTQEPTAAPEDRAEGVLRVRVEALAVVRHLHQQGLVNPMAVLPKVFALAFAGDVRLSEPATVMLKEMLELRPNLLLNRLDEAFREAFLALLCGTPVHLGEALAPQQLAGLGDVYAERFRKQKAIRDSFLRKALQQMQKLNFGRFEERFAELAALGVVDEESESRRAPGTPRRAKVGQLPLRQRQQLLYAQFIASAVGALPFAFESEPLLLVFECNHHLSLHAGTLLASFEGEDLKNPPAPDQVFVDALSIVSCVVLKSMLKREFNLSAEQCATFNPRDLRQERIKSFPVVFREKDEGAVKSRFPAAEWLEKVLPLVDNVGKPKEIAAYIRRLTDADPWDDSRARHENKVDALEGRRGRRKKVGPAPTPGRGRGRGKTAEKAAEPKKKGKRRGYESEDDSDFEGPKGKRPRARREPREEVEAAEERTAVAEVGSTGLAFPLTGTIVQTRHRGEAEAVPGKWSVPAKASPARSREQPSEPQPEPSREPSHRRLTRMPLAPSADPTQRAQDIASALTDAVDSALRSAVAGLKTQICRRAENAADETEATRACYRLLQQLLERHQARAQRFETFALDYLLKMPEGPSEPPAAGAASVLDEEITGLAVPAAWKPKESQSFLEQEISKVQTQLVQSLRKAHAQRREVMHLKQRLSLARAAEEAAGKGGLRRLARELTEVAQQVGQLTGKENRGYENRAFAEIQASPKRRGFLEELEERFERSEEDGRLPQGGFGPMRISALWPETPKRQRHSLLG